MHSSPTANPSTILNPPSALTSPPIKWHLSALCLLCILQLLPLASRPFHIDDPQFIWAAQHIAYAPGNFYSFRVNWGGREYPFGTIFPIPPLNSYFLAAISNLVGWREICLHLAYLPFSLLSLIGTFFLASRFCNRPAFCSLLFLLCPAFWVSSTTVMCDSILLCLWIWAVLFWIWGSEKSGRFFLFSGIAASLAVVTKSTSLGLIPLLGLYALLNSFRGRIRLFQAITLLLPVVTVFAYDSVYAKLYGVGAFKNAVNYATKSQAVLNIPSLLRIIDSLVFVGGGAAIACLSIIFVLWLRRSAILLLIFSLALSLVLASSVIPPSGWMNSPPTQSPQLSAGSFAFFFQFALLLALGLALVIHCCKSLSRSIRTGHWRDEVFLISWIIALFIFGAFLNWSINVRSMLPMLPALCIVVVRGLDRLQSLPTVSTAIALSLGGLLALSVAVGDYHLADTGKAAAEMIPSEFAAIQKTNPAFPAPLLWFAGHWGFQYYMQQEGFTALNTYTPQYKVGDCVVVPASGFGGVPRATGFDLEKTFVVGDPHWVATANPMMGAGFYHSDGYALPFVFGPIPAEQFVIVRVTPKSKIFP